MIRFVCTSSIIPPAGGSTTSGLFRRQPVITVIVYSFLRKERETQNTIQLGLQNESFPAP